LAQASNNVVQVTEYAYIITLRSVVYDGVFGMRRALSSSTTVTSKRSGRSLYSIASRRRQDGMTALGILILVTFLGLFAFAFLRLTPIYLNYIKVAGVVNGVFEEFDGQNATRADIRTSIRRRFNVESVDEIDFREVTVTPVDGGFEVAAVYDHTSPFISNLYFTVKFDKRVVVRR
jgi:hypothetical protein